MLRLREGRVGAEELADAGAGGGREPVVGGWVTRVRINPESFVGVSPETVYVPDDGEEPEGENRGPKGAMDALVGLPAVLERGEDGYVARLEGVRGVYGQGETGEGALENLERAVLFTLRSEAGQEGLDEHEAVRIAQEAVREAREEMAAGRGEGPLAPAPTAEEVRARRDARRRREALGESYGSSDPSDDERR